MQLLYSVPIIYLEARRGLEKACRCLSKGAVEWGCYTRQVNMRIVRIYSSKHHPSVTQYSYLSLWKPIDACGIDVLTTLRQWRHGDVK